MNEPFRFDYYYGAESDQFSFVRIPKLLLNEPRFQDISYGAKVTYAVLLDRMNLSLKNGWHDEKNRVYIRYKVSDLTDVIGRSEDTVSRYLKELEDIGLIERPRRGLGKGKVTYLKNFISPELRDGNLITLENAGNGKGINSLNSCKCCNNDQNPLISDAPEAAEHHITRKSAGIVTGNNAGNVAGNSAGNIRRKNTGNDMNNNKINNTDINNNYHYPNHIKATGNPAGSDNDEDWMLYRDIIRDNIEYDALCTRDYEQEELDGIVDIITEVMVSSKPKIWIARDEYPTELVKGKLMKINSSHIEYVLNCFHSNTSKVYNIKKYLLTSLFNAPSTIESYYRAEVNHDLYSS